MTLQFIKEPDIDAHMKCIIVGSHLKQKNVLNPLE